jgi:DNA-binding NarL/FixJ family response regulator
MADGTAGGRIRIVIADDHPVFLKGLCMLLELKEPELEIAGAATTGSEAVEMARVHRADVVLLDIRMPGMDGVEAARTIRKSCPATKVVMLTTFHDRELIYDALQAGASGYLLKDARVEEIVDAIRAAHRGHVLLSSEVARALNADADDSRGRISEAQKTMNSLTPREQEVLVLMVHGKDNVGIAETLGISERTVRNYVSRIYDVLGVHNRAQAIAWTQAHSPRMNAISRREPDTG